MFLGSVLKSRPFLIAVVVIFLSLVAYRFFSGRRKVSKTSVETDMAGKSSGEAADVTLPHSLEEEEDAAKRRDDGNVLLESDDEGDDDGSDDLMLASDPDASKVAKTTSPSPSSPPTPPLSQGGIDPADGTKKVT